jgi:hypothetical protein
VFLCSNSDWKIAVVVYFKVFILIFTSLNGGEPRSKHDRTSNAVTQVRKKVRERAGNI